MAEKTALVTGAYGFIGRHAARFYARQGFHVIGIGHGDFTGEEQREWGIAEWHTSEVTLDALRRYGGSPDVIIHCAGGSSVGPSIAAPLKDYQRTVDTTVNVLEFARISGSTPKVVYPSSGAVYGAVDILPISEDTLLNPVSPYGVHKKIAEELCASYARHFGVSVVIVRLFSVYGTGLRKQLLWDACKKISKGEVAFWGTGLETRDWLYIEDAAELLFKAGERASTACPVVNGGSGLGVTVQDVLTEIFAQFQRTDSPIFSGSIRQGDPMHYIADISRTKAWGWIPKVEWRKGVREYVEWYKRVTCD